MKPVRLLLLALGSLAALALVAVVLVFNSGVQTWAARKTLAARPELRASVEAVDAGLGKIELKTVRLEKDGAVLTLPSLSATLPLYAAVASKRVAVSLLVARGWTLDLTKTAPAAVGPSVPSPRAVSLATPAALPALAAAAGPVFSALLDHLRLPVDLALDGVDLEGEVLLPATLAGAPAARIQVKLTGGGLAVGSEGRFVLDSTATFIGGNLAVTGVTVRSEVVATMATPRTFSRFSAESKAMATGPQFPAGVALSATVGATGTPTGETYAVLLATPSRQLVAVAADYTAARGALGGTWKIDVGSTDLAPFSLGRPLPAFIAAGEGKFATDSGLSEIRAVGRIDVTADRLAVLRPELAAVGRIRVSADFDLAQRSGATRLDRLEVEISGERPVATVRSRQPFEFNAKTGELKVADPARELVSISVLGLPLAWARPFVQGLGVSGGDVRAEFAATANNGGLSLQPRAPLTVAGLVVERAGKDLVRALDVSVLVAADYSPAGWQATITSGSLQSAGLTLLRLEGKVGQLTGSTQPLQATGNVSADLPALLAQPAAAGLAGLTRGTVGVEFSATVTTAKTAAQVNLAFSDLVADPKLTAETLPGITASARADFEPGGKITLNVPLVFTRGDRSSDLTLAGTLLKSASGLAVDATVTSTVVFAEDVQILAAPFATNSTSKPSPGVESPGRDKEPLWAGLTGQVALALKKVVYGKDFEVSAIVGTLKIDAGALKLVGVRAGFGEGSDLKLNGGLGFTPGAAEPYALAGTLDVANFNPAPVFRALDPARPPTVDGKFSVSSRFSGQARNLGELGERAHGDFTLTSKGGIFRALSAEFAAKAESTSRAASAVAFLGSVAGSVTGRRDVADIGNRAAATAALAKTISAIQYDQLNVVVSRDASLNTVLKDFTLIAPELRLAGSGRVVHQAGLPLLAQSLAMQFQLGARGRTGEVLKALGALDTGRTDDLGYLASTLPLKVTGTLGKPDTGELQAALVRLAYEKSGAGDLLNRFLGGK